MQTIKYKFADATTNEVEVMEKDIYQTAAYIALRQKDGPPMINVPLYVKVSEVNKNGMTEAQESVMHRVSEIMIKRNKKNNQAISLFAVARDKQRRRKQHDRRDKCRKQFFHDFPLLSVILRNTPFLCCI